MVQICVRKNCPVTFEDPVNTPLSPYDEVVNAEVDVQRPAEVRSADREVQRSQGLLDYGDDHARDRTPRARRRECSPTWSSGPRSVAVC